MPLSGLLCVCGVSASVSKEFERAVINGRDGKGCVIVAHAGVCIGYHPDIAWPANLPFVIGVGSMDANGYCFYYSLYGNSIDCIAPDEMIYTTAYDNKYPACWYGLSDSFVAGIAALILSVNPCLHYDEVKRIIALSCKKPHDYYWYYYSFFSQHKYGTWNNEMGYGLPDAYKAVVYALSMPEIFDIPGNVNSISDPLTLTIVNDWLWPCWTHPYEVPNGIYNVRRHEVTATVQFEKDYPLPPLVQGIANGFSDILQNNGRCFMELENVTETEATLRTYVYEVINPGHIKWIPTHPDSVRFHMAVMRDNLHNELFLQNEVEATTKNYTAITTVAAGKNVTPVSHGIQIGDYVIRSGGSVALHAGESITLTDGFHAQAGSFFKTHIEPFFICDYKAPAPAKSGGNEQQYVISNYSVEKTAVDEVVRDYYLKIYPNPSAGEVTVEYNLSLSELVEITLHDNSGKLVYKLRNRAPHEAGVYKITFSGVELPNGIYLCTLKTETEQKTEKLIIAK